MDAVPAREGHPGSVNGSEFRNPPLLLFFSMGNVSQESLAKVSDLATNLRANGASMALDVLTGQHLRVD